LQAVAVRATCFKSKLSLFVVYLPPSLNSLKWRKADIEDLVSRLPPPVLLLGDFDAHSTSWGCSNTDSKGKVIEDFLLQNNLSVLNNGSSTYLHPGTGSTSAVDISICHLSLFLDLSWSAHEDFCGSDQPTTFLFSFNLAPPSPACNANPSWKLSKATWVTFSQKADSCLV